MAEFTQVGGSNGGSYAKYFTGKLSVWENSYDVTNNTSNVGYKLELISGSSGRFSDYTASFSVTINGTVVNSGSGNYDSMSYNTAQTICQGTTTIEHNPDGSKTIACSAVLDFVSGTYSPGDFYPSGNLTLTTIPRKSSVLCADGNIGSSTTININRASDKFTHTLTYSFQGLTGTITTKTAYTSLGWTIPTTFYAKVPNAKSASGTITCETFSGNTSLGTSTCTFTAFVTESSSKPTVSATVTDVNTTTTALTGDANKIVKYFSTAKVVITATAKNSATIKSQKVVCGGKSSTAATSQLANVESNVFQISCTDSRGFAASTTVTKTLVNYIKLAFTSVTLNRPTTTSNTINVSLKANYFNASFGTTANTLTLRYRYKISGGTFSSYNTLTATKSGNTFTYSGTLGTDFSYQNEYVFEFQAVDKLMTATKQVTVTRGLPIIDIGKNDVIVNGDLKSTGIGAIAVLTGTITLDANTSDNLNLTPIQCVMTNKEIAFPTGYNKDNCTVINVSFRKTNDRGFSQGWNNYVSSIDSLLGTLPFFLTLASTSTSTNMILSVGNLAASSNTYYYQIVLMRIS